MEITLKGEGIDDLRSKCMHFLDRTVSLDDWRKKRGHPPYKVTPTEKNIEDHVPRKDLHPLTIKPSTFDTRPIPNVEEGAVSLSPRTLGDIAEELPYPATIIESEDRWIIKIPYLADKADFNIMVSACKRIGAKYNGNDKTWELLKC
jgi:hypothetical protein